MLWPLPGVIARLAGEAGHTFWVAGIVFLASGFVAVGVHSAGFWRLEQPGSPTEGSYRLGTPVVRPRSPAVCAAAAVSVHG